MKIPKWQILSIFIIGCLLLTYNQTSAGTTTKLSNIFTLDTRDSNPIPVDGWQNLTTLGNTFNEDIIIDNFGKAWCFYSVDVYTQNIPVFLKIFKPDGYLYKQRQLVGFSSTEVDTNYNTVRAALNDNTGDIWVAIQGGNSGYFVIFDSTGNLKQDSTVLAANAYFPKVTSDKTGKMWFSWHTDLNVLVESNAIFACYEKNGEPFYQPQSIALQSGVFNTDIAVDDSNHVWLIYEKNESGYFETRCSIFRNDATLIVDKKISNREIFLNTQRQIFSDRINQRMWILEKNVSPSNQLLHIFTLDGLWSNTIENVGQCHFVRNESNQLEVVHFNSDEKNYERSLYNAKTAEEISLREILFDSTYKFVRNGIDYNRNYNSLKVHLVNKEKNLTQVKFQKVNPGYPVISVKPSTLDFDTTKIKESYKKEKVITIQNSGNNILQINSISSLDAHFSVTDTNFQLLPDQSKNVTIQFAPTDTNNSISTVVVNSNDPNNSSVEVVVSGRGYLPTNANIVVSQLLGNMLLFDTVVLGNEQNKHILIQNTDEYEPLKIYSITTTDSQFYANRSNLIIDPKLSEWVTVTFKPNKVSDLITDSLIIVNNDPDTSNFIIPILGSSREAGKPKIEISQDSLKFHEVEIEENKTLYFEVWNRGENILSVNNIITDDAQYTVDKTAFSVQKDSSQIVRVTFTPTVEGLTDAYLTIFSNDPENSEIQIFLRGFGVLLSDPHLVYGQTEINFGKVLVGDSLKKSVIFQNFGDKTLKLYNITTSDNHFIVFNDTIKIEKQGSLALMVTFSPSDTINYTGVLNVQSNDPEQEMVEIDLSGEGEKHDQQISVFPTNLTFEEVLINSTKKDSLIITNTGIKEINVTNIFSTDDNFSPTLTNFNLTQYQTKKVYVEFTPDSAKRFEGKIFVVSNDPVADSIVVTVSGIGRDSTAQIINVSPDTLDFGSVAKNNTSKPLIITVNNNGEKKLEIYDIIASDSAFTFTKNNFQMLGLTSENIYIYFTPKQNRNYTDTLKIITNDLVHDTVFVYLNGIGREPYSQKISVSQETLNFGSVAIDRSKKLTLWITNNGEKDLTISAIKTDNEQFRVNESWFILTPSQTISLNITYTPMIQGLATANLTIHSNDPENAEVIIGLNGTGEYYTGPQISINPETIQFGNAMLGAEKSQALWIYNLSSESILEITNYSINDESFTVTQKNIQIQPGEKGNIQVSFHPQTEGNHSTTLMIYSNDVYYSEYAIELYGYGITENKGQNMFNYWGWNGYSSAPFGEAYAPGNRTANVLKNDNERAWFIKDIYLYEKLHPDSAFINLSYRNVITLIINNTLVLNDTSMSNAEYWNKNTLNIFDYLTLGRNRIAVIVRSLHNNDNGGFDCELVVNGDAKIRRGDQNWNHEDAKWWYYYSSTSSMPTDTLHNRMWYAKDYALASIDTVTANWIFENTGNDTLFDSTPYGRKAILHNIEWIDGINGQAMLFNGSNSYVELNTNLNSLPQAISMWLKCSGLQNHRQNIISNLGSVENGYGIFLEPDMRLGIYYYYNKNDLNDPDMGEYIIPDYQIDPNLWYNIFVQYFSNSVNIYVNNILRGSKSFSLAYPTSSANKSYLGGNPFNQSSFFGAIDDLKIKNTISNTPPQPQVATITKTNLDTAGIDNSVNISFEIYPSPYKILSGVLKYYPGGSSETGTDYFEKVITAADTNTNNPITFTIPKENIDIRGIHYSLLLETNYGTVQYPEFEQNESNYAFIQKVTGGENSQIILRDEIYNMISVPYILDDQSVEANLFDDFGIYNPFHWRLFDWSQSQPDTQYVEFDTSGTWGDRKFERGKAYWIITDKLSSFDAGAGISPPDSSFYLELDPGWNMVGTPFPFPVNWSNITKTDADKISDLYYRSTLEIIGWRLGADIMEPWEGYFIWNADSVEQFLIIPSSGSQEIPLMKTQTLADKYRSKYNDLSILISAEMRCGKYEDRDNLFGVAKYASNNYDKYDLLEAPVIGDYVSLWINNKDWIKNKAAYTVDIRKNGKDGYSWNLILDYSISKPEEIVTLSFKQIKNIPYNWLIYLFDLEEDIANNLEKNKQISFKPENNNFSRKTYKLLIGTEDYIKQNSENIPLVPQKFNLDQNYPNPFNPSTTISFSLPRRMNTTLKIYNILGQVVKTLVDSELCGGNHKIIWNGKNDQDNLLPSGMYFIRIKSQNQVIVKKMLLIK